MRSLHRQRCDDDRPDSIRARLGDKAVEECRRGKGKQDLAVQLLTGCAGGAGLVADGEGVLGLGPGFGVRGNVGRGQGRG